MPRQRWAWTHKHAVPMFVSSLVAVTLSGSGWIAVMVFDRGGSEDGGGTEVDEQCAVGTWELVGYTEDTAQGSARLTAGEPAFTFQPDGSGVADYGTATTVEVTILGSAWDVTVAGKVSYQYQISGETLEFVDQSSNAQMSSDLDILGLNENYTLPEGPLDYSCDGASMALANPEYTLDYRRSG